MPGYLGRKGGTFITKTTLWCDQPLLDCLHCHFGTSCFRMLGQQLWPTVGYMKDIKDSIRLPVSEDLRGAELPLEGGMMCSS